MTAITGPGQQMKEKIPQGYQKTQLQQFTPEQMQLFQQLFSHLGPEGFLSKLAGGDEGAFAEMEAPALRQFSEEQGNIASRFSGMGQGGRNSSGFKNSMNTAASNFAQDLQGKRSEMQQNALKDLFGMSNMLMGQKPFETGLTEKAPSFMEQLMLSLSGGAGQALGSWAGGKM